MEERKTMHLEVEVYGFDVSVTHYPLPDDDWATTLSITPWGRSKQEPMTLDSDETARFIEALGAATSPSKVANDLLAETALIVAKEVNK